MRSKAAMVGLGTNVPRRRHRGLRSALVLVAGAMAGSATGDQGALAVVQRDTPAEHRVL